jgi:hypothetical protein
MRYLITLSLVLSFAAVSWAECTARVASPSGGIDRPCTPQEQTEYDARIAAPLPPPSLSQQLSNSFEQSLTPEQQADLAPLKAAVKMELEQGRINVARLIIQRATIPPELEPLRQRMLDAFPVGGQ